MKRFVARYVPTLWLLAVLSLVGWFIWNGDLAGWILLALVIGLMAWQLTGREKRRGAPGQRMPMATACTTSRRR